MKVKKKYEKKMIGLLLLTIIIMLGCLLIIQKIDNTKKLLNVLQDYEQKLEKENLELKEELEKLKEKQVNVPRETTPLTKMLKAENQGTVREVSAYNVGDPSQTDNSPCVSANGEDVCKSLKEGKKRCAANFVALGTTLEIENYGECLVVDRMNSRYKNAVDIAMGLDEYVRALQFGRQKLNVIIIKK